MSSSESGSASENHASSDTEEDNEEVSEFKSNLSTMSFEELIKLKDELGAKVFKEAMFGAAPAKPKNKNLKIKRLNKNRPREQTSKRQVPFLGGVNKSRKSSTEVRDPRFDKNSGDYNPNKFKEDYKFLNGVREKEIEILQKKLLDTKDEKERSEIKFTMQRLKNKNVEEKRWEMKQDILKEEQKDIEIARKEGRQPHFATKKERRAKELVRKYEELKSRGNLDKHLEKKRKKNAAKDRKKFSFD